MWIHVLRTYENLYIYNDTTHLLPQCMLALVFNNYNDHGNRIAHNLGVRFY